MSTVDLDLNLAKLVIYLWLKILLGIIFSPLSQRETSLGVNLSCSPALNFSLSIDDYLASRSHLTSSCRIFDGRSVNNFYTYISSLDWNEPCIIYRSNICCRSFISNENSRSDLYGEFVMLFDFLVFLVLIHYSSNTCIFGPKGSVMNKNCRASSETVRPATLSFICLHLAL